MSRGSGSKRFQEIVWPLLIQEGPLNTEQIVDRANTRITKYGTKTRETWSIHQGAQILKTSRWFSKVGVDKCRSWSGGTRNLTIYGANPLEEVIRKMVGIKHTIQKKSSLPKFAKKEYEKQEALLNEN
jgi:hypothetical protein